MRDKKIQEGSRVRKYLQLRLTIYGQISNFIEDAYHFRAHISLVRIEIGKEMGEKFMFYSPRHDSLKNQ
jgi:hypothetical protein